MPARIRVDGVNVQAKVTHRTVPAFRTWTQLANASRLNSMPFWDREEIDQLRRIADFLEVIAFELRRPPQVRSVDLMPIPSGPISVGATGTFLATAADSGGNPVAGALATVASSDDTILTVVSDGVAGTSTVTYTAVADGTATVTGTYTNADGTVVDTGAGNPATFTVATAAPDVSAVNFA